MITISAETARSWTTMYRDKETQRTINDGWLVEQIREQAKLMRDSYHIRRAAFPYPCSTEDFGQMMEELKQEGFGVEVMSYDTLGHSGINFSAFISWTAP